MRQFGHVLFDGVDLADFGITLSGEATYNAPERDVTAIEVPGRNGDLVIDNGRFFNIDVTYPINLETELPAKSRALSAFLKSHKGYYRLMDSYHPDEYRMAQIPAGIEYESIGRRNYYGKSSLTFNCKPQRFLCDGDNAVSYTGTATKPTYQALSDFLAANRTILTNAATAAGYDPADISEWFMLDLTSYNMQPDDVLSFEAGTGDAFFAVLFQNDPTSATSSTPTAIYADAVKFPTASFATYVVTPRYFNTRIYKNGVLMADDAAFDYFTLTNPTLFDAKPVLQFDMKSTSLTDYIGGINGCGIYVDTTADPNVMLLANVLTIDTETMDAYVAKDDSASYDFINFNKFVSFTQTDMTLEPGDNSILLNDNTNGVSIIPRWWTI